MLKKASFFSERLLKWYRENQRELPWRKTKNPYLIWLSEIMLQQTRVAQGSPYYQRFSEAFPTVQDLANASEEKVLKMWQGLGYYSRARNLHFTAKFISEDLKGHFPSSYSEILKLKGVGDYTASAIASISFNEATAVVDGNVYRVLARVFGIETPINSSKGIKDFKKLASSLIDAENPGTYNQAVMEFGARYCVPQNPDCTHCIFNDKCEAFKKGKVAELPIKLKSLKVKRRFFNYLVVLSEDEKTLLNQRTEKGIWQQLYEFPLIETLRKVSLKTLKETEEFKAFASKVEVSAISKFNEQIIVHKLSHQHLYTQFWIVETSKLGSKGIAISDVHDYPVPVLIGNFISQFPIFNR